MFLKALGSRTAWVVLAVVAVVVLWVGSDHPPPTSEGARISQLDSLIKCPGCEDLSIAESQASSSVALRSEVSGWVRAGWSNQRIEDEVVSRYGPGGLLVPLTSSSGSVLYIVPIGLICVAVAAMALHMWRRHRPPPAVLGPAP